MGVADSTALKGIEIGGYLSFSMQQKMTGSTRRAATAYLDSQATLKALKTFSAQIQGCEGMHIWFRNCWDLKFRWLKSYQDAALSRPTLTEWPLWNPPLLPSFIIIDKLSKFYHEEPSRLWREESRCIVSRTLWSVALAYRTRGLLPSPYLLSLRLRSE